MIPLSIKEENKSNSITSESEKQNFRQKLNSFQYSIMPKKNYDYRNQHKNKKITIASNLFEIKFNDPFHKFSLFSIDISPEIAEDNSLLRRQICKSIVLLNLPKSFKKIFWHGKNLFSFIKDEKEEDKNIIITEKFKEIEYKIKLVKVKEILFKNVNDFYGSNLQIKSFLENMFRNLIMRNPQVITFHDRTIFEIDPNNIINVDNQNRENIYQGYISSCHITESGLYMLINNKSKLISGKTALEKMKEIKKRLKERDISTSEIYDKIREFFISHKTVLTTYGSLKSYKVKDVDFDKCPENTSIRIKDINGEKKNVSLIKYYKNQYNINIQSLKQPLLIADLNNFKNKKILTSENNNNLQSEDEYVIYLVPELVYVTGSDDDDTENNRRNKNKNIISKTKMDPSKKMLIINNGLTKLINSDNHKTIKKNGQTVELKSPRELKEEWGINLGSNLSFPGRIISQPKLFFSRHGEKIVNPKNGLFRADNPTDTTLFTNNNIFFVFDRKEKSNHRKIFSDIIKKCELKKFRFSEDFDSNKVRGYGLDDTRSWENIFNTLRKIDLRKNEKSFGIIFCSWQLEKYYDKLKNYFLQQYNIPTQHIITKNLENPKRANSIMFNVVDQINIKNGGKNFYINFIEEEIIKSGQVFLIIGLDSKYKNKQITFSMSSTINSKLNDVITQEVTCRDNKEERENTLQNMFKVAIDRINRKCPHCPDFIIIYRQGGNDIRNKMITVKELDNFTGVLREYREKFQNRQNFNFKNTKLYFICCNLKSDLKFFETEDRGVSKAYLNPSSGVIIDDYVTQKSKYEFYLQPQFVNQGTATPCHYQVMYYDKAENEKDDLIIENLEKLSFYLSFYYWTWSGAIRVPAMLKLSNTAMGFYMKVLDNQKSCTFDTPTFI